MNKKNRLSAKMEQFDSFWEAPHNIDKGYASFGKFYNYNYIKYIPQDRDSSILIISCGPGYFSHELRRVGYKNILGIDSDPEKVTFAKKRGLNCEVKEAFEFLRNNQNQFDVIIGEQEINHLTKEEITEFLGLCGKNLKDGGTLIIHSLNGANPITGAEALAQNFDHFNTFTEYSLRQILTYTGFEETKVIPLKLYVFFNNPLNYIGMGLDWVMTGIFQILFKFYGKKNRIFTKKIGAISKKGRAGGHQ